MSPFAENFRVNKYMLLKQQVQNFLNEDLDLGERPTFQMKMFGHNLPADYEKSQHGKILKNSEYLDMCTKYINDDGLVQRLKNAMAAMKNICKNEKEQTVTAYTMAKNKLEEISKLLGDLKQYHEQMLVDTMEALKDQQPGLNPETVAMANDRMLDSLRHSPEERKNIRSENKTERIMLSDHLKIVGLKEEEIRDSLRRYGRMVPYDHEEIIARYNDLLNSERAMCAITENIKKAFDVIVIEPFKEHGGRA